MCVCGGGGGGFWEHARPGNFLDSFLGSLSHSDRILERLGITLTSNGKREFVPRDQVLLCLSPTVQ